MIDDIHAQYGRSNADQNNQTSAAGPETGPSPDQRLPSPQQNSSEPSGLQSPVNQSLGPKNEPIGNLEDNVSPGHMTGQSTHLDGGVAGHSLDSMSSAMTQAFVPDNVQTAFSSAQGKLIIKLIKLFIKIIYSS